MAIEDGHYIAVKFDRPLVGEVSGNEAFFTVLVPMYDMVPEGTLSDVAVPVLSVSRHPTEEDTILLAFGEGNQSSIQNAAGPITVRYAGGTLSGEKGPVLSFVANFEPVGLAYKGGQNDAEHLEVLNISTVSALTRIYYADCQAPGEHLELVGCGATWALTRVDDI